MLCAQHDKFQFDLWESKISLFPWYLLVFYLVVCIFITCAIFHFYYHAVIVAIFGKDVAMLLQHSTHNIYARKNWHCLGTQLIFPLSFWHLNFIQTDFNFHIFTRFSEENPKNISSLLFVVNFNINPQIFVSVCWVERNLELEDRNLNWRCRERDDWMQLGHDVALSLPHRNVFNVFPFFLEFIFFWRNYKIQQRMEK